jgi:hypothetical protein
MPNWLTGWQYRKQITIQGSTGAGTNYTVPLNVGESSGATGYNFHIEGNSANFPSGKNQGGDLRFCYSPDTEILTENGWILLKDLVEQKVKIGVATLNPETNKIEYHYPTDYQKLYFKGKLFHQKGRSVDLLVTPEHRMWVRKDWDRRKKRKFEIIQAKNLPKHYQLQVSADWDGKEEKWFILPKVERMNGWRGKKLLPAKKILMDDWLKFFGFWLAEGSAFRDRNKYVVALQQKEGETLKFFQKLLREWGFNAHLNKEQLKIYNIQLYSYLSQFGHAENKFIPKEIKNLSKRQLEILFEWMVKGDGHKRGRNIIYFTISKQLADDVSEIALKLGYHCSFKIRKGGASPFDKYERKEGYVLSLTKRETIQVNKIDKREWIDYDGFVYDITVPNHIIYIRRNGKAVWSGNCASDGTTLLDFWVERVEGTSPNRTAKIWVKIPDNLGTNRDIYCYYKNPNATNVSNGPNTFPFFEDFNSYTNGDLNGQGGWSGDTRFDVQGTTVYEGAKAVQVSGGPANTFISIQKSLTTNLNSVELRVYLRAAQTNLSTGYAGILNTAGALIGRGMTSSIATFQAQGQTSANDGTYVANTWYLAILQIRETDQYLRFKGGDASFTSWIPPANTGIPGYVQLGSYSQNAIAYWDLIIVRNFITNEPAFSSAGAEEALVSGSTRRLLLMSM